MPGLQILGRDWLPRMLGGLFLGLGGCALMPPQGLAAQAQAQIAPALAQAECRGMAGQVAGLQAVHAAMAREGMALRVLGCPQLASAGLAGAGTQVIALAAMVVDGVRAAHVVRGPLADGELLDMGDAELQDPPGRAQPVGSQAALPEEALSPDVLHNRAWLRAALASQGFRPVAGRWWAFVPR